MKLSVANFFVKCMYVHEHPNKKILTEEQKRLLLSYINLKYYQKIGNHFLGK